MERAFLDLEITGVGDRLRHVEQQEIIEIDIGGGGERCRRPVGLAIAHVPVGQTVDQALAKQGSEFFRNRKRSLLIPQVAQVVSSLSNRHC